MARLVEVDLAAAIEVDPSLGEAALKKVTPALGERSGDLRDDPGD